jgi:hypothetical protein|tara:strand:- start:1020 stop:1235 length:216 start_codon:yes stop_codon:yes gene_type:complete
MAHLITVTDLNEHELLFNLDTAISFERGQNDQTIVTTRWGRTDIKETLDEVKSLAQKSSLEYQRIKNHARN